MRILNKAFDTYPEKLCRAYVGLARTRTGVHDPREYFALQKYTERLRGQFGKHVGLYRIHYYASVAANLGIVEGKPVKALAMICQLLKAIHQVSLANGSWEVADLLVPAQDPVTVPRFSGNFGELNAVSGYHEAMQTVKKLAAGGATADTGGLSSVVEDPEASGTPAKGKRTRASAKSKAAAARAAEAAKGEKGEKDR